MKPIPLSFFLLSFFALSLSALLPAQTPIAPSPYRGWDHAYHAANEALEIVVVPQTGRLAHLSAPGGENLLTFNEGLAGQAVPAEEGDWMNYGGDWFWPVHQDRWGAMGGNVWPPLRILDQPWRAEAWTEEDGTSVIILRRDFAAPLFLQAQRRIELPPGNRAELKIVQSVSRVYASEIPVSLWHISQIQNADKAFLARNPESAFEAGYRTIAFDEPTEEALTPTETSIIFHADRANENKIGTDGHWIAARRDRQVLLQWAEGGEVGGTYPDGGCSIVMYSNRGLGYTEIETQTVEIDLAPGETLRNTLHYRLLETDPDLSDPDLVTELAEIPPARDIITFSPANPTPEDRIEVRVRSREPGGILHWGVNGPDGGWQLPAQAYWPEGSTPGTTGVAVDTPLPDPVDGFSILHLGPFNHPEQIVNSLHAVARWGDRWESRDGENYNLTLQTHPDAANIVWAVDELPETVGDKLTLTVSTQPPADELRIYLNNREIASVEAADLNHTFDTSDWTYGPHDIRVRALREGRLSTADHRVWNIPELPEPRNFPFGATLFGAWFGRQEWLPPFGDEPLPMASWVVTLHAPNARFVELEWQEGDETRRTLMNPAAHGQWFLLLDFDSDTLQYRYILDGEHRFADPWSKDVLWLTPEGEHGHRPEHAWTLEGTLPEPMPPWDRPPVETWVIYELSIPDIAPTGSYKGLENKLDYIAGLGVNAIEPLPVTTFPGDNSWGYNPAFHMGIEPSYGSPQDYADLILAARKRGIANVFDIVLNHIDANSPLHLMHGGPEENPYFMPFDSFNWGFPKLDQENEAFKRYVEDTLVHWVRQWGVDGFRYDATQWIKWSGYNDWGVSWMSYVVNKADPGVVQIAENLPSEPDMVKGTELDSEWDGHYRWRMRRVFVEGNFIGEPEKMREILDPRNHAYQQGLQRMAYIESHDEERFVRELLEAGYSREEAFRRHHAAAAITLTVPGIPMLYAGQEWGETTQKVVGLNPLQWELREEPDRAAMLEQFRELIHLRTQHRALHHDRIEILHLDNETGTAAYLRPGVPESVLVTFNVSKEMQNIPWNPQWTLSRELHREEADKVMESIDLHPGEARIFLVTPTP
ncbi:MAG: hypothetical protein JJU29_22780 [Verrucomicrobia bacterium]|nr:hypothetical protein [Verrucomicrobiota bacterium]